MRHLRDDAGVAEIDRTHLRLFYILGGKGAVFPVLVSKHWVNAFCRALPL